MKSFCVPRNPPILDTITDFEKTGKLCLFFHLLEALPLGSILRRPVSIMVPSRAILVELNSTDKKTRDKAIKNLSLFLSDGQNVISKPDMDKLWKGIFYCALTPKICPGLLCLSASPGFWMSDKPLVQQGLATELAELILTITTTSGSLIFLRGFWETTVREWNGIDRLRCAVPMRKLFKLILP